MAIGPLSTIVLTNKGKAFLSGLHWAKSKGKIYADCVSVF